MAWILDMDGILSHTQVLHSAAEATVLRKYGCRLSEEEIEHRYAGISCAVFFRELIEDPSVNVDLVVEEKWDLVTRMTIGNVRAVEGSQELLRKLNQYNTPMAVASGSRPSYIALVLNELRIMPFFQTYVSGEEVPRGKPHPDVFLEAARRLKANPADCTVVEDGIAGMHGTLAAGMRGYGLAPSLDADVVAKYPRGILFVKSLRDIIV